MRWTIAGSTYSHQVLTAGTLAQMLTISSSGELAKERLVISRESVYPALLFLSLLQEWQYSYFTSLPEGLSLSQFLSQSDDPSQASQWSRSIVETFSSNVCYWNVHCDCLSILETFCPLPTLQTETLVFVVKSHADSEKVKCQWISQLGRLMVVGPSW